MINKLRKKFILYSTLSIFALLAVILSVVNIVNFSLVTADADNVTQQIADRGGSFQNNGQNHDNQNGDNSGNTTTLNAPPPMGPESPETESATRYFTYYFDNNGNGTLVAYRINSYSQEETLAWAKSIYQAGYKTGWSKISYRYRQYVNNGLNYVTVIDYSEPLLPSYRVLWASLGGGIGGVALSFLILLFVSKKFVKPIEESDRRQKLFIADASLSLKDPVTIIGLNNDLLLMKNGESEEGVAISKQVGKLTKIITELNELAALEKVDEVPGEVFDFSSLLSISANEHAAKFEEANKKLSFNNLQAGLEYKGDQEQFHHLFEVIFDNALKYSLDKAELTLSSQEGRIAITLVNEANYDLPEGDLDLYFERFIRGEGLKEANIPGSGLGLAIARDIIKIYNGRIAASGKDKVFTLKIEL